MRVAALAADAPYAYRPPGGATFDHVAARIRAALADLNTRHPGERVLIMAHDAAVGAVRHILAGPPFTHLDAVLAVTPIANASRTRHVHANGRLGRAEFASTPPAGHRRPGCSPRRRHPPRRDGAGSWSMNSAIGNRDSPLPVTQYGHREISTSF